MGMCEIVIRKETGCADRDSYLMVMCAYKKWVKFEPGLMRVFNLWIPLSCCLYRSTCRAGDVTSPPIMTVPWCNYRPDISSFFIFENPFPKKSIFQIFCVRYPAIYLDRFIFVSRDIRCFIGYDGGYGWLTMLHRQGRWCRRLGTMRSVVPGAMVKKVLTVQVSPGRLLTSPAFCLLFYGFLLCRGEWDIEIVPQCCRLCVTLT